MRFSDFSVMKLILTNHNDLLHHLVAFLILGLVVIQLPYLILQVHHLRRGQSLMII